MNDAGTAEKLLIDGLYPTLEDERGQNGVYYACIEGSFDVLRAILANQVSIETKKQKDSFLSLQQVTQVLQHHWKL